MPSWKKIVSSPSSGFTMGVGSTIIWEGTDVDEHKLMLTALDVSADRTITMPNDTGTIALTGTSTTQAFNGSVTAGTFSASGDIHAGVESTAPKVIASNNQSSGAADSIWMEAVAGGNLVFGGSAANSFKTTLVPVDQTDHRTIAVPDRSGSLCVMGTNQTQNFAATITAYTLSVGMDVDGGGPSSILIQPLSGGKITFEGLTDNGHQTVLSPIDPTQDNDLELPDKSGTLLVTSDLSSGTSNWLTTGNLTANGALTVGSNALTTHGFTGNIAMNLDSSGTGGVHVFNYTNNILNGTTPTGTVSVSLDHTAAVNNSTTGNYLLKFPFQNGTIAITDDIPTLVNDSTFASPSTTNVASTTSIKEYTDNAVNTTPGTDANLFRVAKSSQKVRRVAIGAQQDNSLAQSHTITLLATGATGSHSIILPDSHGTLMLQGAEHTGAVTTTSSIATTDIIIGDTVVATDGVSGTANSVTINSQNGGEVIFEGLVNDNLQTTLRIVDPTGDNIVKLPDTTGVLLTELSQDATPVLGGDLDLNGSKIKGIDGTSMEYVGSSVLDKQFNIKVQNTGSGDGVLRIVADKMDLDGELAGAGDSSLVKNESTMSSNSNVHLATQWSIKQYVDNRKTYMFNIPFLFKQETANRTYFRDADHEDKGQLWSALDWESEDTIGQTITVAGSVAASGIPFPVPGTLVKWNVQGYQKINNNNEFKMQLFRATPTDNTASGVHTAELIFQRTFTNYKNTNFMAGDTIAEDFANNDLIYLAFRYISGTEIECIGSVTLYFEDQ